MSWLCATQVKTHHNKTPKECSSGCHSIIFKQIKAIVLSKGLEEERVEGVRMDGKACGV